MDVYQKIIIECKKTQYMILSLKTTQYGNQLFPKGIPIESVKMFKLLGVLIDEHFT